MIELYDHQKEALDLLRPGTILFGGVGSGKTLTALSYYQKYHSNKKLFVITTAKKRNDKDWVKESELLDIFDITIDSWNNVDKFVGITDAFFIFDEQRAIGSGKWSKCFIKIAKANTWILLTGTPGDTWTEYIPAFIANGFYKNKTDFIDQHIEYDRFAKYPKVKAFHNQGKLIKLRDSILVHMPFERNTERHRIFVNCKYDKQKYEIIYKHRWDPYIQYPIPNVSKYQMLLRRSVIESYDRLSNLYWIIKSTKRLIVFYNYNYELDMIREFLTAMNIGHSEWNGQKHDDLPTTDEWIYLVQYTAGAEGWNCITTNRILFFSTNYSYKMIEQAEGRIDRLNTKYKDLIYIYLTSDAPIDLMIRKAYNKKKKFNMAAWSNKVWEVNGWEKKKTNTKVS